MKILFTGYAPVHFICFKPLYEDLRHWPDVEVSFSGGIRTKTPEGRQYDASGMYGSFGLPSGSVLSVDEIRERDFDVLFCASTKPIMPRRVDRRIQIFHGMSFRNRAIRPENMGYDDYFVLGPYMLRGFERTGLFTPNDSRAVKIGFPKTDRLLNGSLDRRTILRQHGFEGDRPVLLYAPTGEKRNSLETMGEEVISRLREVGAYDVLVKPHDHPHKKIDWFERLAPYEDEHLRLVRTFDVIPYLLAADLLISDASSVANEYALLDRSMIFLDVPKLLALTLNKGALLDLETWGRKGGEIAKDPTEALEAVADGLAHPGRHAEVRSAMVRDLFYNPGQTTDAALAWLRRELGLAALAH